MTKITGNTFPVKDRLKALGAMWDAIQKAWMIPEAKAEEARQLVSGAGAVTQSNQYRPIKCVVCGATERRNERGYPEVKIYRSGECASCYEERKMGY